MFSYSGYAVVSGKFRGGGIMYVALGGPRGNGGTGQVSMIQNKIRNYILHVVNFLFRTIKYSVHFINHLEFLTNL